MTIVNITDEQICPSVHQLPTSTPTERVQGLIDTSLALLSGSISSSFAQLRHDELNNLLADDHAQYLHVSGTHPMVGNLNMNSNSVASASYIDLIPHSLGEVSALEGRTYYDSDDHTFAYWGRSDTVTIKPGQEHVIYCVNKTTGTIWKGAAVYVSGALGSQVKIDLADANSTPNAAVLMGLTLESIPVNESGYCVFGGVAQNLNTSLWPENTILYLSEQAGELTTTPPTGSSAVVFVGQTITQHATQGILGVRVINSSKLEYSSDVLDGSPTAAGSYLISSGGYWTRSDFATDVGTLVTASVSPLSSSCAGTDNQIIQLITDLSGSVTSSFSVTNQSITDLSSSCAGTDNQLSAAITNLSSSVTSSFANLSHASLNNLGADDHTQYLHISGTRSMAGPLDVGGFNLTNFVTTSSLGILLASGSSLTQVFSYVPTMSDLSILTMGIRLLAWETATKTTSGVSETEVTCQLSGSTIVIKGTPVFDKSSKGFPTTFDCAVTSSADAVIVLARPNAAEAAFSTYVWHQNAINL